jgi:hypothetical protein
VDWRKFNIIVLTMQVNSAFDITLQALDLLEVFPADGPAVPANRMLTPGPACAHHLRALSDPDAPAAA